MSGVWFVWNGLSTIPQGCTQLNCKNAGIFWCVFSDGNHPLRNECYILLQSSGVKVREKRQPVREKSGKSLGILSWEKCGNPDKDFCLSDVVYFRMAGMWEKCLRRMRSGLMLLQVTTLLSLDTRKWMIIGLECYEYNYSRRIQRSKAIEYIQ